MPIFLYNIRFVPYSMVEDSPQLAAGSFNRLLTAQVENLGFMQEGKGGQGFIFGR